MRLPRSATPVHTSRHEPLLGTDVVLRIEGMSRRSAHRVEAAIIERIESLEKIFTVFDDGSELCRYRSGQEGPFSQDLTFVLTEAERWHSLSNGAFNAATGALKELWASAALDGTPPTEADLERVAHEIARPDHSFQALIDLNGIAKGYIVDNAAQLRRDSLPKGASMTLSAGGDLIHLGSTSVVVGIEDPHRPHHNAEPRARVRISNKAIATSGSAHRHLTGPSKHSPSEHSHILDPRTGQPAALVASATVVASSAMDADVLATILSVVGNADAATMPIFNDLAWMTVSNNDEVATSEPWDELAIERDQ